MNNMKQCKLYIISIGLMLYMILSPCLSIGQQTQTTGSAKSPDFAALNKQFPNCFIYVFSRRQNT